MTLKSDVLFPGEISQALAIAANAAVEMLATVGELKNLEATASKGEVVLEKKQGPEKEEITKAWLSGYKRGAGVIIASLALQSGFELSQIKYLLDQIDRLSLGDGK